MTNAEVESIACLYADLSEYDRKALTFAPHFKKREEKISAVKKQILTHMCGVNGQVLLLINVKF